MTLTLAIIGAGPLGRRLAIRAARAGLRVVLEDVMPASLRHAEEALRRELGPEHPGLTQVSFAGTVEDAVREADLVIDCVPDELESKLEIFSMIDRMAPPRTVLATPTTTLSIADLASCTYRAGQCVGLRLTAAELAAARDSNEGGQEVAIRVTGQTTEETRGLVCAFWVRLGYLPVIEIDSAVLP